MGSDFNKRRVGIQLLRGTFAALTALNKVYLDGQWIIVKMPDGSRGVKCGDWDDEHQAESAATRFNDLPWLIPPSEFGASKLNVFFIDNTDPDKYTAAEDGGSFTIADNRLKGKTGYPVFGPPNGGVFRDDQISYDENAGTATITGFVLEDQEKVFVVVPTGISADPDYVALEYRMTRMEAFLAPILKGGVILPWNKPVDDIPDGWRPVAGTIGKVLIHADPTKPAYDALGKTGGAAKIMLAQNHIPEFDLSNGEYKYLVKADGTGTAVAIDNEQLPGEHQINLLNVAELKKVGKPVGEQASVDTISPFYAVAAFIEPDPELLTLYPFL